MAVRHALAAGGGKIVYEYDFGAGWTHEIALQKKLPRDCAAVYPVCTKFSGDSPVEYPEEELWYADEVDVAEPGPASLNRSTLRQSTASSPPSPAAEGA